MSSTPPAPPAPIGPASIGHAPIRIAPIRLPDELEVARALFTEYVESLGIDLSFQSVDEELADLPGKYAPPKGMILIARAEDGAGEAVGCIALRPMAQAGPSSLAGQCEMKRLYVRPQARGHDLGRRLTEAIVAYATEAGYSRILLDTLASMRTARKLYASLGFYPIDPYYENPVPGTWYLARDLR